MTIGRRTRNFVFSIALALALPVSAQAATVFADGKEWRQVTDTLNTSWNTLAASCDTTTGVCGGAYDGWTWASGAEVISLFESFAGFALTLSPDAYFEMNSPWAPLFLTQFTRTIESPLWAQVSGQTRSSAPSETSFAALRDSFSANESDYAALQVVNYGANGSFAAPGIGAWMYVTAPVPEPEIYAMMGLGLGLMGWAGRRKRLREAQSATMV